jgi:predicted transcriptional regulator
MLMPLQSITLTLPSNLLTQLQQLGTDSPETLHQFVVQAIEHELQRRQPISHKQAFWDNVETIRTQMQAEGIEIDPDEIWGDVRDRSPGREVVL